MRVSEDIGWQIVRLKEIAEALEWDRNHHGRGNNHFLTRAVLLIGEAIEQARNARDNIKEQEESNG